MHARTSNLLFTPGVAKMQIGVDSFGAVISDPASGITLSPVQRMQNLLEEIEVADRVGLDVFGIGEHHRAEFLDSAPAVILSAAATRTKNIRLSSAVTVLSAADPVRVFQEFATLDLISNGRAEIVAGRGSFVDSFPLFGFDVDDYDALFSEKLELLLKIRENTKVRWSGKYRASLTGQAVYPRPVQNPLPIWVGVGGTPESFVRAGTLGLPLMVAIIGGEFRRFRPLVDLYRDAGRRAGHAAEKLNVGLHAIGFLADTTQQAADDFFPGYAHTFTEIGKERGWPPTTRAQFDAVRGPTGALLVGDAETVAKKIIYVNEVLGGLSRITFQMGVSTLPHQKMLRSIEILGTRVAPIVRKEFSAASAHS
jgi:probable LLM family oxidoreductase